jgi:hypothetical protein
LPNLFSGATLPLLFHHLRERSGDLGALAGRIYSWNTIGSLLGALFGGYALLFWLDLHHVYRIAVASLGAAAPAHEHARGIAHGARCWCDRGDRRGRVVRSATWSERLLSSGLFRVRTATEHSYEGPPRRRAGGIRRHRRPRGVLRR